MNQYYKSSPTSRKYYLTTAPQCPYPDANLHKVLTGAHVDMAFIQFYNSGWCDNSKYGLPHWPQAQNYYMWEDAWQNKSFANPNMKMYVGATAGSGAGNPSSYVSPSFFAQELKELQGNYTQSFGGAMMWDMSWAYGSSPNYAANAKQALMAGSRCSANPPSSTTTTTGPASSTSSTKSIPTTATSTPPATASTSAPATTSAHASTTTAGTGPVAGGPCSSQGTFQCADSSGKNPAYFVCNNGAWLQQGCGSGTACFQTGSSIYCNWPSS
ncbi:Chitinase 2 [Linderina pennispora]|nr:Chitinase 2 [Linderina pennispora]